MSNRKARTHRVRLTSGAVSIINNGVFAARKSQPRQNALGIKSSVAPAPKPKLTPRHGKWGEITVNSYSGGRGVQYRGKDENGQPVWA